MLNFSIVTCQLPPSTVNGTLDDSDTVQEGRLGRTGVVSSCGTAKVCPGINVKANQGGVAAANFRNDVKPDGTIDTTDGNRVKARRDNFLP